MFSQHAADAEVAQGEAHRGVGLQFHPFLETVDVEAADFSFFIELVALFVDNRGYYHHLFGGEAECFGFFAARGVPHVIVLAGEFL